MTLRSTTRKSWGLTWRSLLGSALFSGMLGAALAVPACSGDDSDGGTGGSAGSGGSSGAGGSETGGSETGGSDGGEEEGGMCPAGGGAVTSDAGGDTHCIDPEGGVIAQAVGACPAEADAAPAEDGGAEEPMETRYGNEADDDDCKYHAVFSNTCISLNKDVTFTLTLTKKTDGTPATGGNPDVLEAYLASDETHISPSNNFTAPETSPGVYTIGPVRFDMPGLWIVRFHYFHECSDVPEDSPHGHVAFYVNVPN
jgi:hypothetical protein